jgi:hypothetical protein
MSTDSLLLFMMGYVLIGVPLGLILANLMLARRYDIKVAKPSKNKNKPLSSR